MIVCCVWLGDFVEKGFLTALTEYAKNWRRQKDCHTANWDGGIYNDRVYGILTVVDGRGYGIRRICWMKQRFFPIL
jgi:multiple sugar transport system substrate-binding protein